MSELLKLAADLEAYGTAMRRNGTISHGYGKEGGGFSRISPSQLKQAAAALRSIDEGRAPA